MNIQTALIGSIIVAVFTSASISAQDVEGSEEANGPIVRPHDMSKEERREMRKKFHKERRSKHERRLQELDSNQDEKVDLTEFLANAEKRFNELDADNDGYVTREEARSRHHELRQKHKEKRKKMLREHQSESQGDDV